MSNLHDDIKTVVEHVNVSRKAHLNDSEKKEIIQRLVGIVKEGNYSFSIDHLNIRYMNGTECSYPRLYGDAIMHYTVTMIERLKKNNSEMV